MRIVAEIKKARYEASVVIT